MLEETIVGNLSELGFRFSRSSLNLLAEKEPWEFRSKEGASFGEDIIQFWEFFDFDIIQQLQHKLGFQFLTYSLHSFGSTLPFLNSPL